MKSSWPLAPVVALVGVSLSATAAERTGRAFINAGAVSHNMTRTASKPTGDASTLGPVYPTLGLAGHLGPIRAEFAYSLSKKDKEGNKSSLMLAGAAYRHTFTDYFEAKTGLGAMFYSIKGEGGAVTLNNGNSTAVFYRPERKSTSRVLYLDLGVGVSPISNLRIDLDFIVPGVLTERRSMSLLLQAGYSFL